MSALQSIHTPSYRGFPPDTASSTRPKHNRSLTVMPWTTDEFIVIRRTTVIQFWPPEKETNLEFSRNDAECCWVEVGRRQHFVQLSFFFLKRLGERAQLFLQQKIFKAAFLLHFLYRFYEFGVQFISFCLDLSGIYNEQLQRSIEIILTITNFHNYPGSSKLV